MSSFEIESALADGRTDEVDRGELQRMAAAVLRCYAAKVHSEGTFSLVPPGALNATEAMIVGGAVLRSANVNLFELGLWQSWSSTGA
jgi:hypothetical protein